MMRDELPLVSLIDRLCTQYKYSHHPGHPLFVVNVTSKCMYFRRLLAYCVLFIDSR